MTRSSAGILPYRQRNGVTEVFLVHPGGPFWQNKDDGAWSIAKGEYDDRENALDAARREFAEETGVDPTGTCLALQPIKQRGGKTVIAWAVDMDFDAHSVRSNTFTMEWPPKSGKRQIFPEVDRGEWFPIDVAQRKILGGQLPLLAQLKTMLTGRVQERNG